MYQTNFNWIKFTTFQSTAWVQKYLQNCYELQNIKSPEMKSFENCYPFIYYLEHGEKYYKLSSKSPTELKPVLLFYGMTQLIKACLLTVDPDYPESTSVLAHGASTRKRKKKDYYFLDDEIKVQKNGLFTHFANKIFSFNDLEGEKFKMNYLFKKIPEMSNPYTICLNKPFSIIATHNLDTKSYFFSKELLDFLHMTFERFIDYIQTHSKNKLYMTEFSSHIEIKMDYNLSLFNPFPFLIEQSGAIHLPLERDLYKSFPELMAHYLLLYNLSMICRYETEWWSDLFHTRATNDYPLILQFLAITEDKVPYLIYEYLSQKIKK
jgi:hypothetical protein